MRDSPEDPAPWKARAEDALRTVVDPEVGVNLVDLGLIYGLERAGGRVAVTMTMTSPGCPLGGYLADEARAAVLAALPDLEGVDVHLVWEPPWSPERMSAAARRQLGADPEDGGPGGFTV